MVNTRILEQRLGWKQRKKPEGLTTDPENPADPEPEQRPIRHEPLLQGKVRPATAAAPRSAARRAGIDALWAALPQVADSADQAPVQRGALHALDRTGSAAGALDQLRSQLMRAMRERNWRSIGITSPRRGAGRSFIAAGLAASVARLNTQRVLLVDLDLAAPDLAQRMGLEPPAPLEDLLTGALEPDEQLMRLGPNLALAVNRVGLPDAAEFAQGPVLAEGLRRLIAALEPDIAVFDLPPLLDDAVTPALLPQMDTVLLVADGTRTTARDISECEQLLEGQVPLLGVILNKSDDSDPRRAARTRS